MRRYMVFAHPGDGGWGFDESYTKREKAIAAVHREMDLMTARGVSKWWANVLDGKTGDVIFSIEANDERTLIRGEAGG